MAAGITGPMSGPRDLNSAALIRARVHPALSGLDGAGVVIVVIDYGFDLLHPALRAASGETRFAALINQNGATLARAEINQLIRAVDKAGSRETIDAVYDPHANYFGPGGVTVGAHGTWVASIAAGSASKTFTGVAPKAVLVGVQLDLPDHAWSEVDRDGHPAWRDAGHAGGETLKAWNGWRAYDESAAVVHAIEEGLAAARALSPDGIVINLSIGAWAGGHDAASPVNRAIEQAAEVGRDPANPMTAIVTGTGNAGADAGHVSGTFEGGRPMRFGWSFGAGAAVQAKLEIWSDSADGIAVEIAPGFGDRRPIALIDAPGHGSSAVRLASGEVIGVAEHRGNVRGGFSSVRIILAPALASQGTTANGGLAFEVTVSPSRGHTRSSRGGNRPGTVHAWIERNCAGGPVAKLIETQHHTSPDRHETTLTSLACAPSVIAVAGLDNHAAGDMAIPMSGCGPRPWRASDRPDVLPAPLIAAPANSLFGARSKTSGYMRGSGTSGAAAIVSGASALAMQAATISGRRLDNDGLVNALTGRASGPGTAAKWRADLGFGALRFDASALTGQKTYPRLRSVPYNEEASHERNFSPPN